jgi:hypothetical protein
MISITPINGKTAKVEITKLGQKGYIARISGNNAKYGFARSFLPKEKSQVVEAGIYEIREGAKGQKKYWEISEQMFQIPGDHPEINNVVVKEIDYNTAVDRANAYDREKRENNTRGITVTDAGTGRRTFYERKSYKSPRIQSGYPDRYIPGNPEYDP